MVIEINECGERSQRESFIMQIQLGTLLFFLVVFILSTQGDHHHHHDHEHEELTFDQFKEKVIQQARNTPAELLPERIQKVVDFINGAGPKPSFLPEHVDCYIEKMDGSQKQQLIEFINGLNTN